MGRDVTNARSTENSLTYISEKPNMPNSDVTFFTEMALKRSLHAIYIMVDRIQYIVGANIVA